MTKEILLAIAAFALLSASLSLSFRFVKPRGNQADFIIGLLSNLSDGHGEIGKITCGKSR